MRHIYRRPRRVIIDDGGLGWLWLVILAVAGFIVAKVMQFVDRVDKDVESIKPEVYVFIGAGIVVTLTLTVWVVHMCIEARRQNRAFVAQRQAAIQASRQTAIEPSRATALERTERKSIAPVHVVIDGVPVPRERIAILARPKEGVAPATCPPDLGQID